jgi:hypothetical protein
MNDFMYNAIPNGGYIDDLDRIEQARLEGEYQGWADQAVYEAILEARLRKKERGR